MKTAHKILMVLQPKNILADADMELTGTSAWTAVNNATLSKQTTAPFQGLRVLRVARNGTNSARARQSICIIGVRYRVTGYCRSDGNATPRIINGANVLFTGTTSTDWQRFDVIYTQVTNTFIDFESQTSTGTEYTEWDDLRVYRLK